MKQPNILIITGAQGVGKSTLANFIKSIAPEVEVFDPMNDPDKVEDFKRAHSLGLPCVLVSNELRVHEEFIYRRLAGALIVELKGCK